MKLPISLIVILAIVVLVLLVLVSFFLTAGGGAASRTELQRSFTEGCLVICSMEQRTDVASVRSAYIAFDSWQRACEQLYSVDRGAYMQCLTQCSCGTLPTLCERLQRAVNDVGADCPYLCEAALTHPATRGLYGDCDCRCGAI